MASAEDLLAIPEKRAAKLAGISVGRLRYWEKVGLVAPSIRTRVNLRKTVRLYNYGDLMQVLVAAVLRTQRGMTLQHMRDVVGFLRKQGYQAPLRELRFAALGKELYFQHSDGTWVGGRRPQQPVLEFVLPLEPLRARLASVAERDPDTIGEISTRRGVQGSQPVIAGTRIRVASVRNFLNAGYDTDAIIAEYPDLTAADIEAVKQLAAAS